MTVKIIKNISSFETKDKVTVHLHGKPDVNLLAKKMIELYNQKLNRSTS